MRKRARVWDVAAACSPTSAQPTHGATDRGHPKCAHTLSVSQVPFNIDQLLDIGTDGSIRIIGRSIEERKRQAERGGGRGVVIASPLFAERAFVCVSV